MSHRRSRHPVPEILFPGEPAARNGKRPPGSAVLSGPCPDCEGKGNHCIGGSGYYDEPDTYIVCQRCGGTGRARL